MNLTIPREDLLAALNRVKPLCGSGSSLPILGSVLLKAEGNTLIVTGNNLDHCLALTLAAAVEKPGKVAVSCARLRGALAGMKSEDASLSTGKKGQQLVIAGGEMSVSLFGYDAEEFPGAPKLSDAGKPLILAGGVLAKWLAKVLPFVSGDEARYALCGVYFCADGAQLRLVGTDGRRLICVELGVEAAQSVIVPTAAAKLLAELDGEGEVTLSMGAAMIEASGGNWRLSAKLIEGIYPSFKQVIPPAADGKRRVTVNRAELLGALPFVGCVLAAKTDAVRLKAAGTLLSVTTNAPEVGEAAVKLGARLAGEEVEVAFNTSFLAAALAVLDGEDVTLAMRDEQAPTRMDEPGTTVVLMPMRIL